MPNLILTTNCQRSCPYCFAKDDKEKPIFFEWHNFKKAVTFLETGQKIINLIGGEPTTHKDFVGFLEYLIDKDFNVQVFTNGIISEKRKEQIKNMIERKNIKKEQLFFCVNSFDMGNKQFDFLKTFNEISYLSYTIFEKNTDLTFLPEIIEDFRLDRTIRLGLAMPIGVSNKYLNPADYSTVSKKIVELTKITVPKKIQISFDCGFPLCMFTPEEINNLNNLEENDFMFSCGVPLDIYPDLKVSNCYPLSRVHKTSIIDFDNVELLYEYFKAGFEVPFGIYGDTCKECLFFGKVCSGGCKGFYSPQEK